MSSTIENPLDACPQTKFDDHRVLVYPGNSSETLKLCVRHWISVANEAIQSRGQFIVALSGGSTPKAIFQQLSSAEYRDQVPWDRVFLFWGDERSVPSHHKDSNYRMAMTEAGLGSIPALQDGVNVFRMSPVDEQAAFPSLSAEAFGHQSALSYQRLLQEKIPGGVFDLVMLGVGEDGHTASLFPGTKALHPSDPDALVLFNEVPQLSTWRMTLTYTAINKARAKVLYVLGVSKAPIIEKLFKTPLSIDAYPSQGIGTLESPAFWILDFDAKL